MVRANDPVLRPRNPADAMPADSARCGASAGQARHLGAGPAEDHAKPGQQVGGEGMKPRVAVYINEDGSFDVYADDGVEVYSVCDWAPNDRLYLMSPEEIPEGMLDGEFGFLGDGSPAETRAKRAAAVISGESYLKVVSDDDA
jgi:hypothetical protein